MKVDISHVEKKQGMVFKKTLHGVTVHVQFNDEEKTIIDQRNLKNTLVLERGIPADVNAEKFENRGLTKKLVTAAVSGRAANHFHLTISKLLNGPDTYFTETPGQAKDYEAELKEALPKLKDYIMDNAGIEQKDSSFEL